jgi:hypothetical protein
MTKQIITLSLAIAMVVAVSSMGTSASAVVTTMNPVMVSVAPTSQTYKMGSNVKSMNLPTQTETKVAVKNAITSVQTYKMGNAIKVMGSVMAVK